ncbi:uncharacterized protein CMU_018320 [Cryptosporidium muris RN66]|uniref:Uncharacterized protein n=1 Tax=Cryptosporidium muris (strain RN66) TaxID=441375 RepID=B6AD71_CRYMR|nr:uncharacterized protein CMU_018320 [Cryptosporidium muris RN66]EEA06075.1 hypothetical protein CMU_018320 [Cryptosporidium muris RN66]|eukprot:XP_002140424.1 hypothetical protein [Cryptosporidium muris RN66]
MQRDIETHKNVKKDKEFLTETNVLVTNILDKLGNTLNLISQVDTSKQRNIEDNVKSYYLNVSELSRILNERIDQMRDHVEIQVNADLQRLLSNIQGSENIV